MSDNNQEGTVSQRPITATDNEWRWQCQDCQLHWGRGGITHEGRNMTNTADGESTQNVKGANESDEETRRWMCVRQRQTDLGRNNRMHRLQAQEGKSNRGSPRQNMPAKEAAEGYEYKEINRQHGQNSDGERENEAGRRERLRRDLIKHQRDDRQEQGQNQELVRATQTSVISSHRNNMRNTGIRMHEVTDTHVRWIGKTVITRPGAEETGTGYYISKLMSYQRALHMSGNQMQLSMWEGALLRNRDSYVLIRVAVHLVLRGWADDICRLGRQNQSNLLHNDTGEEEEYKYPYVRTRIIGPCATETHTDRVYKTHGRQETRDMETATVGQIASVQIGAQDRLSKRSGSIAIQIGLGELVGYIDMSCLTGQIQGRDHCTQRGPLNHQREHPLNHQREHPLNHPREHPLNHPHGCQLPHPLDHLLNHHLGHPQRSEHPKHQVGYLYRLQWGEGRDLNAWTDAVAKREKGFPART